MNIQKTPIMNIKQKNHKAVSYITKKNPYSENNNKRGPIPFMVADIETLPFQVGSDETKSHVPYAAGYMVVRPGETPDKCNINRFYSEDYKVMIPNFLERSTKLLTDMFAMLFSDAKKLPKMPILFLHNLARFDGIILLRHLALFQSDKIRVQPLLRNSRIYEIVVLSKKDPSQARSDENEQNNKKNKNKDKVILRIRDSCLQLSGSLADLAESFCPEAGGKGQIDHESVTVETLDINREMYLDYLDQDIALLGRVMQKAQDLYWKEYKIDIVYQMTISSLALSIFRMKYYDDENHRIYIPNKNADTFIRSGFYGGHTDMYIPVGSNLFSYDVNSLYPFVMANRDMPGGPPVWHSDLTNTKLTDMFGFIKALVITPDNMDRPFLPYRGDDDTLLFPTGKFIGVFFSEELIYAQSIGYRVLPLSGYLFKRMESPFKKYVNALYNNRLEAKASGNKALSYILKILLNSLFGRFGISPESTITKLVKFEEANEAVMRNPGFIDYSHLGGDIYILSCKERGDDQKKTTCAFSSAYLCCYYRLR